MSRYHGRQFTGASKTVKDLKRKQAEQRNQSTIHTDTKRHRLHRCESWSQC